MEPIYIISVILLIALCFLLMRRITKLEDKNFDLNEKLNLSDGEYNDLFNVNLGLSEQIENFAKTRMSETLFYKEINFSIGQNNDDNNCKIPEFGTKEFNDLCREMFGGKPKK